MVLGKLATEYLGHPWDRQVDIGTAILLNLIGLAFSNILENCRRCVDFLLLRRLLLSFGDDRLLSLQLLWLVELVLMLITCCRDAVRGGRS